MFLKQYRRLVIKLNSKKHWCIVKSEEKNKESKEAKVNKNRPISSTTIHTWHGGAKIKQLTVNKEEVFQKG
jgi:hypothetical protein